MIGGIKRIPENPTNGVSGHLVTIDVALSNIAELEFSPLPFDEGWILAGGTWDDAGVWRDSGLWND